MAECEFIYPVRWWQLKEQIEKLFDPSDEEEFNRFLELQDFRDRAIEDHLAARPCAGAGGLSWGHFYSSNTGAFDGGGANDAGSSLISWDYFTGSTDYDTYFAGTSTGAEIATGWDDGLLMFYSARLELLGPSPGNIVYQSADTYCMQLAAWSSALVSADASTGYPIARDEYRIPWTHTDTTKWWAYLNSGIWTGYAQGECDVNLSPKGTGLAFTGDTVGLYFNHNLLDSSLNQLSVSIDGFSAHMTLIFLDPRIAQQGLGA